MSAVPSNDDQRERGGEPDTHDERSVNEAFLHTESLERRRLENQVEVLRAELARERRMLRCSLRQHRPTINSFHGSLLQRILLGGEHDDLLVHVSVCARVCSEWRRSMMSSDAYAWKDAGETWLPQDPNDLIEYEGTNEPCLEVLYYRGEAMATMRTRLSWAAQPTGFEGSLLLHNQRIGDMGARVVAAALAAWTGPALTKLRAIRLANNRITAVGLQPVVRVLRTRLASSGLTLLDLSGNSLGDDGIQRLAQALPQSLRSLSLSNTGCGDAGLAAVVKAIAAPIAVAEPGTNEAGTSDQAPIQFLEVGRNPIISDAGWRGLADALPRMPALRMIGITRWNQFASNEALVAFKAAVRAHQDAHQYTDRRDPVTGQDVEASLRVYQIGCDSDDCPEDSEDEDSEDEDSEDDY